MPRRREWWIDGQHVTLADVRRWMQSVAWRIPQRAWWDYIRDWNVPAKIAAEKRRGTLDATIAQAAADAGRTVRAARRLGTLQRLRRDWPAAANCGACCHPCPLPPGVVSLPAFRSASR